MEKAEEAGRQSGFSRRRCEMRNRKVITTVSALLLVVCTAGCGQTHASEVFTYGAGREPVNAPVVQGTELKKDASDKVLEEYAENLTCLYGKTYTGYVSGYNGTDPGSRFMGYDITEIPTGPIAYYICDFDRDGQEELLTLSLTEDYSVSAEMYESEGGRAVQKSSILVGADYYNDGSGYDQLLTNGMPSFTNAFVYDLDGTTCIGFEFMDIAIYATGVSHNLYSYEYADGAFQLKCKSIMAGSTIAEDLTYDPAFADEYQEQLQGFGARTITVEEMVSYWNCDTHIADYLTNVREIFRLTAEMHPDFNWSRWDSRDGSRMPGTVIRFAGKEELQG